MSDALREELEQARRDAVTALRRADAQAAAAAATERARRDAMHALAQARASADEANRELAKLARDAAFPPPGSAIPRLRRKLVATVRGVVAAARGGSGLPDPKAVTVTLPWRVALVGDQAWTWLGAEVWPVALAADPDEEAVDPLDRFRDVATGHLDAIVVDAQPTGWTAAAVGDLLDVAAERGVPVIGLAAGTGAGTPWFGARPDVTIVGDPAVAGPGRAAVVQPFVATDHTPAGFTRACTDQFAVALAPTASDPDAAIAAALAATGPRHVKVIGRPEHLEPAEGDSWEAEGTALPWGHAQRADDPRALRGLRAVLDHAGAHRNLADRARQVVRWCAAGVPVIVTDLDDDLRGLLGPDLADAVTVADPRALDDLDVREALSVRQRRLAHSHHDQLAAWRRLGGALGLPVPRPTSVSAVMATNRPDYLLHGVASVASQAHPSLELVVGLHGDAFGRDVDDRLRDAAGDLPLTIRHVPADATLGDVLNAATEAASGEVVTKVDDDDHYSPHHVTDLLVALRYSGADLVGKGSEFVYLAELDVTVRRWAQGAETPSTSVGGGTLTLRRSALADVGGWQRVRRAVDRCLIDDVLAAGGRMHRTHGFGFVLNRHGVGHTWDSDVDYFLSGSVAQRRGLDRAFAGLDG